MSGHEDDEAWRSIVENYGEQAPVEDAPLPEPEPPVPAYADLEEPEPSVERADPERFVPPVPPPGPPLQFPRHLPWLGVFGSPTLLLVATLTGIDLPAWAGYLLVGAFAGGFVWLVATMRRGGRDPWDDGARV